MQGCSKLDSQAHAACIFYIDNTAAGSQAGPMLCLPHGMQLQNLLPQNMRRQRNEPTQQKGA